MGAEATCRCRWPGGSGEVKALLETRELILRGFLRRVVPLAKMANLRVEGDSLSFTTGGETIALELGAARARRWAEKIANPPTLAAKLGIGPAAKAWVIGTVTEAALLEALSDGMAASPEEARLSLAVVTSEDGLAETARMHETLLPGAPIWIIHGKGKQAAIGDNAVRRFMRAAGYIDTKISGVSDTLSATRYARR